MDEGVKELFAMSAAAAANRHPCMEQHLAKCDEPRIPRDEVMEAVGEGLTVSHGAEKAIRKHARRSLAETAFEAAS